MALLLRSTNFLRRANGLTLRRMCEAKPKWTDERLRALVDSEKVVSFIKGTEDSPMCGFSLQVIRILQLHLNEHVKYVNILADEELRTRMKEFSDWKTFPQVYIDGQFVGGCDIMTQLHKSGELMQILKEAGLTSLLEETF